jgi:ABC-type multidrug transport system fused ATPase/permease subunit
MAYWGGGGPGGWSGGGGGGGGGRMWRAGKAIDGWDYDELGAVYDPALMRRLLPFLKPYKWRMAFAIFAMAVHSAASYSQPFIMAWGVGTIVRKLRSEDPALIAEVSGDVLRFGLLLVGLGVVSFAASWTQHLITGYVGHSVLRRVRSMMFEHLQRLSLRFYDNEEVGRVMSRVTSDVVTLQELLTTGALQIFMDLFGLTLIVVFLFALDPLLALVTLAVVPVLVGAMMVWQRYAAQAFIRVRQAIALVNSNINENVSGVRVVQSLNREKENLRQFEQLNEQNRQMNLVAARLQAAVMPLVEVLSTVAMILVLVVIGIRLFAGNLSAADAASFATGFMLYIQRFFNPVRNLVMQYTQIQRATAGAHRIFEVLDTRPEIVDAPDAVALPDVEGRVDFSRVWFAYVDEQWVLRDFDLHVQPGETVALAGHTGAGKTSVTALLSRFYDIQKGELQIDGHDIKKIRLDTLRSRMSVVLQEPYLFSGTVAENIRYGKLDASQDEIERAAKAVGAHDFVMRLEHGYETVLHERGSNLSVGQRQLISFARALIADPRILILDEATANVDTQTEKVIQSALATLLKGRTSFVIAHRLSTIRSADRIVVMRNGEVVEIGSHDELIEKPGGVYADLYSMTYTHLTAEAHTEEAEAGART